MKINKLNALMKKTNKLCKKLNLQIKQKMKQKICFIFLLFFMHILIFLF